ncbi:hypothetical protein [Olivibacter sitiensis]|uniref:hypothetical protein n=1 Tax=Olivibacter sitiensis TaxID=376470 RepID=UPI000425B606|nr:hypothetical protein [Olivibacter sitiensis]
METTAQSISFLSNFKENKELIAEILELTLPSYVSNAQLIDREIMHNRDIYLIRSDEGELLAFFMVNFESLGSEETFYLGLSACREEHKSRGLVKSLYMKFLEDCRSKERLHEKKYLLWWTTATPVVYYWFNKHVARVQPDMDGAYDELGKHYAIKIIGEKFRHIVVDEVHPFILRKVAEETNYSEQEKMRLKEVANRLNFDIFDRFLLDEAGGDRFLMIGYAPDNV